MSAPAPSSVIVTSPGGTKKTTYHPFPNAQGEKSAWSFQPSEESRWSAEHSQDMREMREREPFPMPSPTSSLLFPSAYSGTAATKPIPLYNPQTPKPASSDTSLVPSLREVVLRHCRTYQILSREQAEPILGILRKSGSKDEGLMDWLQSTYLSIAPLALSVKNDSVDVVLRVCGELDVMGKVLAGKLDKKEGIKSTA